LLGCIRVRRSIGLELPRYWYHLGCVVHAAADLGLFHRERTLLLGNDHTGACEISDFQLDRAGLEAVDRGELSRVLVLSAVRQLRAMYGDTKDDIRVIAALTGHRDAAGESPFWHGFGAHFFPGDAQQASARFGHAWLTHVAALLPRHPIVVSLLHARAQASIGLVAECDFVWRDALLAARLRPGQSLTLYDAGPVYEGSLDLLATEPDERPTVRG